MLRRRPDGTFEFRQVEEHLALAMPPPLSPERKDALRLRIMAQLGEQEPPRGLIPPIVRERWIVVPAGISLAAAIFAANHFLPLSAPAGDDTRTTFAQANGQVRVNGRLTARIAPGEQAEAITVSWIGVGEDVSLSLDAGTSIRYFEESEGLRVELAHGNLAVAAARPNVTVVAATFNALLRGGGTMQVDSVADGTWISVAEGTVEVRAGGKRSVLSPGDRLFIANPRGADSPGAGQQPSDSGGGSSAPGGSGGEAPGGGQTPAGRDNPGRASDSRGSDANEADSPTPSPEDPGATPTPATPDPGDTASPTPAAPQGPGPDLPPHGGSGPATPTPTSPPVQVPTIPPAATVPPPASTPHAPPGGGSNQGGGAGQPGVPGNGGSNQGGGAGQPGVPGNGRSNTSGDVGVPDDPGNGGSNQGGGAGVPGVPGNGGSNQGGGAGKPSVPGNGGSNGNSKGNGPPPHAGKP